MTSPLTLLITFLTGLSLAEASFLFLLENMLIIGLGVAVGRLIIHRYQHCWVAPHPPPISRLEWGLTASTLVLNTLVTVVGWWLWKEGVVVFRAELRPMWIALDIMVLISVMDVAMYGLHRLAHHPILYPLLHETHHRFEHPRPLTLFALNPAEAIAFGGLWLVVISIYDATWIGMSCYLTLNVIFGMVGHLGVEFLPAYWLKLPGVRHLAPTTFHTGHHLDRDHNFGFYTTIWDRLFRTLATDYPSQFQEAASRPRHSVRP